MRSLGRARKKLSTFPNYSELLNGTSIPLNEFTSNNNGKGWLLDDNEALLTFIQMPGSLFAVVARRNTAHLVRLDLSESSASEQVQKIRATLSLDRLQPFDVEDSGILYTKIWAPVLASLDHITRIAVVLSGPLQSLPLELLAYHPRGSTDTVGWI